MVRLILYQVVAGFVSYAIDGKGAMGRLQLLAGANACMIENMNRRGVLFPNCDLGLYRFEQNRRMPLIKQSHIIDDLHVGVTRASDGDNQQFVL